MTSVELKKAAIKCLVEAFTGGDVPVHLVQAATSIVLTPLVSRFTVIWGS